MTPRENAIKRRKRLTRQLTASRHGKDRDYIARLLQERTASLNAAKEVIKSLDSKLKNIQYLLKMGLDEQSIIKMIKQSVSNV